MIQEIKKFIKKKNIEYSKINYLTREDRKTIFHMENGDLIKTYLPIKDILNVLSPYGFISINKGVIINKSKVIKTEDCNYFMNDGTILVGRQRSMSSHRNFNISLDNDEDSIQVNTDIYKHFSILDDMPMAFCVIELQFDPNGKGVDFIFRYCNKYMEILEGKTREELINNSFYKVFPNADKKWLVAYADVAINGNNRVIYDYSSEVHQDLIIRCYQPFEGYCACLITSISDIENIIHKTL